MSYERFYLAFSVIVISEIGKLVQYWCVFPEIYWYTSSQKSEVQKGKNDQTGLKTCQWLWLHMPDKMLGSRAAWAILCMCLLYFCCRFTKNLSADKINLSTFKGEGELSNLELDETVLTELLELPSWLRLTSAWCNRVSFRIQWTKLKSVPIFLVSYENVQKYGSSDTLCGLCVSSGG